MNQNLDFEKGESNEKQLKIQDVVADLSQSSSEFYYVLHFFGLSGYYHLLP